MKGLDLDPDSALLLPESVRDAVLQRVDKLSFAEETLGPTLAWLRKEARI